MRWDITKHLLALALVKDLAAAFATVEAEGRLDDRIVAHFVVLLKHPG